MMIDGEEDGESGPVPTDLTVQVNTYIPSVSFNMFPSTLFKICKSCASVQCFTHSALSQYERPLCACVHNTVKAIFYKRLKTLFPGARVSPASPSPAGCALCAWSRARSPASPAAIATAASSTWSGAMFLPAVGA